jgi:hypothetical protein
MITTRSDKLKFIVEEMVEHARGLRRPLNAAGYDTRDYHEAKEVYASNFTEYFKISRDRLGAHVQDFDFGKRVEIWNDIEIVKIRFFVEGAQEIYRRLMPFNLPGYVPYAGLTELTDPAVLETPWPIPTDHRCSRLGRNGNGPASSNSKQHHRDLKHDACARPRGPPRADPALDRHGGSSSRQVGSSSEGRPHSQSTRYYRPRKLLRLPCDTSGPSRRTPSNGWAG